jgi:hypothetical protein
MAIIRLPNRVERWLKEWLAHLIGWRQAVVEVKYEGGDHSDKASDDILYSASRDPELYATSAHPIADPGLFKYQIPVGFSVRRSKDTDREFDYDVQCFAATMVVTRTPPCGAHTN